MVVSVSGSSLFHFYTLCYLEFLWPKKWELFWGWSPDSVIILLDLFNILGMKFLPEWVLLACIMFIFCCVLDIKFLIPASCSLPIESLLISLSLTVLAEKVWPGAYGLLVFEADQTALPFRIKLEYFFDLPADVS